jgi:hypothetical protein
MTSSLIASLIAGTRFTVATNKTANGWKYFVTDSDTLASVTEDGFVTQAHAQAQADREVERMRYGTLPTVAGKGAAA